MADAEREEGFYKGYERRPIPDPTILTTQQLTLAIAQVKEAYQKEIAALRDMLEERDKRYNERYEGRQKWLETAITAMEKAHVLAMETNQRAIEKAEIATEKRFDAVNEFRNTLSDQQRTFMPRAEIEAVLAGIRKQIETVQSQLNADHEQKKGVTQGWGLAVGAGAFVLLMLGIISGLAIYVK